MGRTFVTMQQMSQITKAPLLISQGHYQENTYRLPEIISNHKFRSVVLTGSVFEQGEGKGTEGLRAVSSYGLSKGCTSDVFKYFCEIADVPLAKIRHPQSFWPL